MDEKWNITNSEKNLKSFKKHLCYLANGDDSVELFLKPLSIVYTISSDTFKLKKVYSTDIIDVLSLPSYITEIDSFAFKNISVEKVIANKVKRLNSMAFKNSLCKEVILPSVSEIKEEAFYNSHLEHIEVSNDLKSIGTKAFAYCNNFKEFSCNTIRFMGEEVFLGSGLQECYINTIGSMCFNTFSVYKNSNIIFSDNMNIEHLYCGINVHSFDNNLGKWLEKNFVDKNIRQKLIDYEVHH